MEFLKDRDTIVYSELVVYLFDKFINSKKVYNELISMKSTQYSVVDIIKDKWNEIKGGKI